MEESADGVEVRKCDTLCTESVSGLSEDHVQDEEVEIYTTCQHRSHCVDTT
jgi:hypothetical protein